MNAFGSTLMSMITLERSEGTQAFEYLEYTWPLDHLEDTQAIKPLEALRHSGTQGSQAIGHLGARGTHAFET